MLVTNATSFSPDGIREKKEGAGHQMLPEQKSLTNMPIT